MLGPMRKDLRGGATDSTAVNQGRGRSLHSSRQSSQYKASYATEVGSVTQVSVEDTSEVLLSLYSLHQPDLHSLLVRGYV